MPLTWPSWAPSWLQKPEPVVVEPPKPAQRLVTLDEYWKGRASDSRYVQEWTFQIQENAAELLSRVNRLLAVYGHWLETNSGWRPYAVNLAVGGARTSAHLTGEAIDLSDADGAFKAWLRYNAAELEKADLYMEAPASTPTWVHLQTRKTASGKRVFIP